MQLAVNRPAAVIPWSGVFKTEGVAPLGKHLLLMNAFVPLLSNKTLSKRAEAYFCIVFATAIELGTKFFGAPFGVGTMYLMVSSSANSYASHGASLIGYSKLSSS
jgi:hypothetical protein